MLRSTLVALVCGLAAFGCGNKGGEEKKAATQVAARVNKDEISVHQVNNVLARAGAIRPEQAKIAAQQVLDKLIEQDLLVQQSIEKKLDRDPRVMQAIEASRREILARSYLEQLTGGIGKPDDAAIKTFYDQNPGLFSDRRIYNLQELLIQAAPDQVAKIQQQVSQAKSLSEVANYLKAENIQFAVNGGTKAAEQLPMELLPKLLQLKDGQSALIPTQGALTLIYVLGSQPQPMDEAKARPFIEQFLTNQKRTELAANEVKQLKERAKIEYVGDFSRSAESGPGAAGAVTSKAAPEVPSGGASQKPADNALQKGIQGLK